MAIDHPFLFQARRDLERAEHARLRAEAMLRNAESEINRLRSFIEQYEIYAAENDQDASNFRIRGRGKNLIDMAVSIVESSEGPISIQNIFDVLVSQGIEIGGGNKLANLAGYLSKDSRVRYERGLGWMISADALFPEEKAFRHDHHNARSTKLFQGIRTESEVPQRRQVANESDARVRAARRAIETGIEEDIQF